MSRTFFKAHPTMDVVIFAVGEGHSSRYISKINMASKFWRHPFYVWNALTFACFWGGNTRLFYFNVGFTPLRKTGIDKSHYFIILRSNGLIMTNRAALRSEEHTSELQSR